MELSFALLLLSFAFALVAGGVAWAQFVLADRASTENVRTRWALAVPAILAVVATGLTLVFPQFDVTFGTQAIGAALAALAALMGLLKGRAWTVARGVLWALAASVQAFAVAQAIAIL